ncbi:MAG: FimV/HubP family polar landmark protein, partial [Candidatus Marithrix sp.]
MRKFITFLILMIVALNTNALGLSHIQLYSKLNEPLNSKINILSIPKGKSNVVRVSLASARAFRRAGLDRPFILTKIDFTVQKISKTSAVITVSSQQPIKEPFLNFLVEVSWPGGRILREYTVLLDPPLYKPISAKKLITRDTKLAIKPKYPPIQKRIKPKKRVTKKRITAKSIKGSSYTVFKNDTLSQIAQRTRPAGVSLNEQMRKIYQNNPKAFINRNRNRIKSGKILKIPDWDGKLTKDELAQIAKNSKTNTEIITKNTPKAPESSLVKESISNKRLQAVPKLVLSAPKPTKNDIKNTTEFKKLQHEIINLTEKNSSIESENKVLKEEIAATKGLVINMKQQLDEMNNMLLAFKNEGFAKLQDQLAKQAKENKRLKDQLANLKTAPKEIEDKKLTFKPTARLPSLGEHNDESIEDKPVNNIIKPEQTVASNKTITESIDIADADQKIAENSEITTFGSELADSPKIIEPGKTIRVKNIESDEPDFITMIDELVKENIPGGWITIIAIIIGIILLIIIVAKKRKPKSNEPGEWKITKLSDEEIALELSRLDEESKTSNLSEPNILEDIKQTTGGEDADAQFEVDPKFDKDLREEVAQYTVAEKYSLAEDLIESAIKKYPHHHKYRLELLEVYADAKEIDKFEKQAQLLYNEVDGKGPLWDETLELWKYLSPNKELSINNVATEDNNSGIAAVAGVAVGAGIAAVALSGSDESDEIDDINDEIDLGDELDLDSETGNNIDDGTTLDLGDDLDLGLDNDDDSGNEIQDLDEEVSLEDKEILDLGNDSDEEFELNSEDGLAIDNLDDTEDSAKELLLDDDLSLGDLDSTEDSTEELLLDDDELSLDDLDSTEDSTE